MEKIDMILWVIGTGFSFILGLLVVIWAYVGGRFDRVDNRIDKLDEKVTDIDRRLCRLEGAFSSKDCCMIKEDKHLRQAE